MEAGFIQFRLRYRNISPLKAPFNWAIFTTQLILRLKTSVMKRAWSTDNQITVWEE